MKRLILIPLLMCGVRADAAGVAQASASGRSASTVARPEKAPAIPSHEWAKIRQVAVNYDLDEESTWLLAAIRKQENGRPGLEFGIGGPMNSGHRAHRYRDGHKSFYVQAMWAAGTIRRHYRGDLDGFAKRYNPGNPSFWARSVANIIRRLKRENGHKLPGAVPKKTKIEFP